MASEKELLKQIALLGGNDAHATSAHGGLSVHGELSDAGELVCAARF